MDIETLTIYEKNMSCNECLTNVVKAVSTLKYVVEFDIDLKKREVTLIYEAGHYGEQSLKQLVTAAVCPKPVLCPSFT